MQFIEDFIEIIKGDNWHFDEMTKKAFILQKQHNPIYAEYLTLLNKNKSIPSDAIISHYPFLPISFFKTKLIKTGNWKSEIIFTSSGTSGKNTSNHHIYKLNHYKSLSKFTFESFYGSLGKFKLIALLPSYFEQPSSSLLYMIDHFIQESIGNESCFILPDLNEIQKVISKNNQQTKLLIWGVSYALLDLLDVNDIIIPSNSIILETGGMKGRRREITKDALHDVLKMGFRVDCIHSEYGMTELSSQAYALCDGIFRPSKMMKVFVSNIDDPLTIKVKGRGLLNIIDLANIHSCCFIQTEDVGEVYEDGSFRIFGRLDNSQLRGCNMLYPN